MLHYRGCRLRVTFFSRSLTNGWVERRAEQWAAQTGGRVRLRVCTALCGAERGRGMGRGGRLCDADTEARSGVLRGWQRKRLHRGQRKVRRVLRSGHVAA